MDAIIRYETIVLDPIKKNFYSNQICSNLN